MKAKIVFLFSTLVQQLRGHWQMSGILALGFILRLYRIVNKELWYDEVLDILQSQKSIVEIFQDVKLTPLHYLFVHLFSLFSSKIEVLRIPGVLFGIASIFVLYAVARKLTNKEASLFAAFLLAISPMAIEFSQQILHYSYFIFFTLVSLYYFLDVIFSQQFRVRSICLFLFFSLCNLATHLSAFIIVSVEVLILVSFILFDIKNFWSKVKTLLSQKSGVVLVVILSLIFAIALMKTNYVGVMKAFTTFNLGRSIRLGYSLSNQLHTEYVSSVSLPFLRVMFAWFGLGDKVMLALYFTFFIVGCVSLFKTPQRLFFLLVWIFFPFFLLFVVKIDHWFEEKYLIFIMPMYLVVVSVGVNTLLRRFFKRKLTKALFMVMFLFFVLAVRPIQTRTTYGFAIQNLAQYSWLQVFSHIPKDSQSAVFTLDDLYSKIYLGEEWRNKSWYTDQYLVNSTPRRYQDLVSDERSLYYASIPDFNNLKLSSIVDSQKVGTFGNINLTKIRFKKTTPVEFEGMFIDDFIKLDYLKNAADWNNIEVFYPDVKVKNGIVLLQPTNTKDSYITYPFVLEHAAKNLQLKIGYFQKNEQDKVRITAEYGGKSTELTQAVERRENEGFVEEQYGLSFLNNEKSFQITFSFNSAEIDPNNQNLGLRYIKLYDANTQPILIVLQEREGQYFYDAQLESAQTTNWLADASEYFGWFQNQNGLLYRAVNDSHGDNPLTYAFALPVDVTQGVFTAKTYTFENALSFELSNDGKNFLPLATIDNEQKFLTHELKIPEELLKDQTKLYLRINSKDSNEHAVLRTFELKVW